MPEPTPEGGLIRSARESIIPALSIPAAAHLIGVSPENWGHVERGYQSTGRGRVPRRVVPVARTLAHMAWAVRVTPDQLAAAGRPDAAKILRYVLETTGPRVPSRATPLADIQRALEELASDVAEHVRNGDSDGESENA